MTRYTVLMRYQMEFEISVTGTEDTVEGKAMEIAENLTDPEVPADWLKLKDIELTQARFDVMDYKQQ